MALAVLRLMTKRYLTGSSTGRSLGLVPRKMRSGKRRMRTFYFHKLATYYHGWRQRRHVEQFGVEQLRVLTVTTSEKRIETMLDAQREVTNGKGSDLFLFIDEAKLEFTDPLEAEWVTGKGNRVRLTD